MSAIELVHYRLCGSRGGGSPSRRDPFSIPGCGCLWLLGDVWFFCGRVVPEARTGLVLPPFWWFLALGYGFVWGALGTFVFVCFFPVGTSSICAPAFGCSGVGLVFS